MDLPNVKELKAILKLCREQGVNELTMDKLCIKFGDLPRSQEEMAADADPSLKPSEEDMLFWSSQPDPLSMMEGKQ